MDTTKQNAKQAVALTTILTLFVAGFELLIAFTKYRTGSVSKMRYAARKLWSKIFSTELSHWQEPR